MNKANEKLIAEAGSDPRNAGTEVVGNPRSDDRLVYCSKREWEWWVNALNDAHAELDAKDTRLEAEVEARKAFEEGYANGRDENKINREYNCDDVNDDVAQFYLAGHMTGGEIRSANARVDDLEGRNRVSPVGRLTGTRAAEALEHIEKQTRKALDWSPASFVMSLNSVARHGLGGGRGNMNLEEIERKARRDQTSPPKGFRPPYGSLLRERARECGELVAVVRGLQERLEEFEEMEGENGRLREALRDIADSGHGTVGGYEGDVARKVLEGGDGDR